MKLATRIFYVGVFLPIFLFNISEIYAQPNPPESLDVYVEQVCKQFDVPGMGLAIVKDGELIVAQGYGMCDTGKPAPVDAHTLFAIASNTKAFTATALGILVEEGKLKWDDPVINHLPWFQLSDPYVTREITVRDLLVHRSGLSLGQGDLLIWPSTTYDRREIVRRLRYLDLKTGFRSKYAYDNVLYVVAGELIETLSGRPWEEFVTTRIFTPIGMSESTTEDSRAFSSSNVALPFAPINEKVERIDPEVNRNIAPAAGIYSSAADMAKWLIVQLDSGRVDTTKRLFSAQTTRELWGYVTPIPIDDPPPELVGLRRQFNGYALGFQILDYRGHKVVRHTGMLLGYISLAAMIPDLRLGVAVLTNQESWQARDAIANHILDYYLGATDMDWISAMKAIGERESAETAATEQEIISNRDSTAGPSLPLSSYIGSYTDKWYGEIFIEQEGDRLVMRFSHTPALIGDMDHWQHDTFLVRWRERSLRADAFITFALNPDGTIDQGKMKPVSPATDFSFDFQDLLLKPSQRDR